MHQLAEILAKWLGNPIRAMSTLVIASIVFVCLYPFQWFRHVFGDSVLRWPTGALIVGGAALSTYIVEHRYKKWDQESKKRAEVKRFQDRFSGLSGKQLTFLSKCLDDVHDVQISKVSDKDIADLVRRELIFCQGVVRGDGYYKLAPDAQRHLVAHPELLRKPSATS